MNYSTKNSALLPKIRKVLMKYNFALIMALQIMFFSCTKDKVVANLSTPKVNSKLDGVKSLNASDEEVFMGIVYQRGPVASLLGDFASVSIDKVLDPHSAAYAEAKQKQDQSIAEMKSKYPGFLAHFRAEIGSGDYNRVNAVLQQASDRMVQITANLNNRSMEEMNQMSTEFITANNLSASSTTDDFAQAAMGVQACIAWLIIWVILWVIPLITVPGTVEMDSYLKEDLRTTLVTEFVGV